MHDGIALGALPFQFAIPAIPAIALLVDEIDTWPDPVAIAVPVRLIVIDRHGMSQPGIFQFLFQLVDLVLRLGFRCMNPDDDHFRILVAFLHFPVPGIVPNTVDSAERKEMDNHHFATQFR